MVTVPSKMLIVAAPVTIMWNPVLGYRYTPVDHPHPKGLPGPAGPPSNLDKQRYVTHVTGQL